MADNIMEQPHRFQLIQQHQQQMRQQRMEAERRAAYQQQQQQRQQQQAAVAARSDSSITAATLIDAIITHQINQTAEGGREVVQNAREPPRPSDRLFQSFHREQPSAQDNNGERSPPVINVDLESEQMNKNLTVKELTDTVISHDFGARQQQSFYHMQDAMGEQWKRRMQQKDKQQDERQIIRMAQPQKYHEPVSPSENNHWSEHNFRRYQQPQSHISALDYVKNKIVEVMRTEDDKKEAPEMQHPSEKDRDSPGEMVIDEEKHEGEFGGQQQQQGSFPFAYVPHKDTANDGSRNVEPKPLLSEQYEPLSDED